MKGKMNVTHKLSFGFTCFAAIAAAQNGPGSNPPANVAPPTVYVNPRSPDDPRVGLKPGLYDAGEAAFGLEKLMSMPKPPGFAPGNFVNVPNPLPPPEPPPNAPPRPPSVQYGSTNSDIAFSGNHLFVGNY